jgi:hypothetical protein
MATKEKTIERIFMFIDYVDMSVHQFGNSVDLANGYLGRMRKNNGSVGSDILEKILIEYPNLNAEWLITGIGEMILKKPRKIIY